MRTLRSLTSSYGFLALALLGSAPTAPAQSPDHEAIRRIKTVDWPRAYQTQDVALLDRILADDFRVIRADGRWASKGEELDWIRHNRAAYDSLVFRITRLDVYPNGTAVVAGTGVVFGREANRSVVTEYQSTNILLKQRDGTWRAIASHTSGTRVRPGAGG
ncbi:MAG: nuclear transport factor 2 family protein [Gemmatimonadetes bacterium]|nr:nuclear transport factor 2 family protein [Gemmatimonadota bacterium]